MIPTMSQGPGLEKFQKAERQVRSKLPSQLAGLPFSILWNNRGAMVCGQREIVVPESSLVLPLPALRGLLAHEAGHLFIQVYPRAIQRGESEEAAADRLATRFSSAKDFKAFWKEATALGWPLHR